MSTKHSMPTPLGCIARTLEENGFPRFGDLTAALKGQVLHDFEWSSGRTGARD